MSSCTIYIVRHGESEHNRDNIISGHVNPALTKMGKEQAAQTKEKLQTVMFDEAYSSDLQRAIDTGGIIYGKPIPVSHQLAELRERNYGAYDGGPDHVYKARAQQSSSEVAGLNDHQLWRHHHSPGVESNYQVATRFIAALHKIAEANLGKTVLVAAHGGTIRVTLITLGYATQHELPSRSVANAAYSELIYKDGEFTVGTVYGANKVPV